MAVTSCKPTGQSSKAARLCVSAVALLLACLGFATPAFAQTFSVQSVPDSFTAIYGDGTGRTITVTGEPQNTSCLSFDANGRVTMFTTDSVAACDRSLVLTFTTNGFLFQSLQILDIDDIDGIAPRDTFAANVPGTWTSPTLEVYSFSSPPGFADQAARLTASGAVGTFVTNSSGTNPTNESATFTLTTPVDEFSILFDDVEDFRNAEAFFDLDGMLLTVAAGTVVAVSDSASGIDGVAGASNVLNAFDGDTLNGVDAGPGNTTLAVASGSSVPAGLSFNTTTGQVDVAPGTPGGTYSFDYTLCEIGFPTNCQTATITVDVIRRVDLSVTKTNTPGVNGNVDQADDAVISGSTTTYTIRATNSGPDAVDGAIVTDTPGAGITCSPSAPVTITGDGVPAGSFTFADLSGSGITLGTLTTGQTAILTYDCQVN